MGRILVTTKTNFDRSLIIFTNLIYIYCYRNNRYLEHYDSSFSILLPLLIISYWDFEKDSGDKRRDYICMGKEEALAVASAILKLFKEN